MGDLVIYHPSDRPDLFPHPHRVPRDWRARGRCFHLAGAIALPPAAPVTLVLTAYTLGLCTRIGVVWEMPLVEIQTTSLADFSDVPLTVHIEDGPRLMTLQRAHGISVAWDLPYGGRNSLEVLTLRRSTAYHWVQLVRAFREGIQTSLESADTGIEIALDR